MPRPDGHVEAARDALLSHFGGTQWNPHGWWLEGSARGWIQAVFDEQASDDTLCLTELAVEPRGTGIGTEVIEKLRDVCEERQCFLYLGPIVNTGFVHPRRFPWINWEGDDHGDPAYGWNPEGAQAA